MPKSCPAEHVAGRPRDKEKQRERGVRDEERRGRGEEKDHREVTERGNMFEKMQRWTEKSGWGFNNKRKEKQKDKKTSFSPSLPLLLLHFLTYEAHFGYQGKGITPRHLWHGCFSSPESY